MPRACRGRVRTSHGKAPEHRPTKHRRKGWVASTVRKIVRNEAYICIWTFKKRR